MASTSPLEMKSARILVADDDADMRAWLRDALESAGYGVLEAADGKKAMIALKRQTVDLIILDLFMPVQEGIETIQQLQQEYPKIKIIAISGAFQPSMLRVGKRLGAAATLQKPIELSTLLQTVEQILKQ